MLHLKKNLLTVNTTTLVGYLAQGHWGEVASKEDFRERIDS